MRLLINISYKLNMQENPSKIEIVQDKIRNVNAVKTVSCSIVPNLSIDLSQISGKSSLHTLTCSQGRIPASFPRTPKCPKLLRPLSKDQIKAEGILCEFELQEIEQLNEIFYLGNRKEVNKSKIDDKDGNLIFVPGDHLLYRFEILELLGSGTFGTVVKCIDHEKSEQVAVKILKNESIILESGKNEIKLLDLLQKTDATESNIVKKKENFWFRGHICIVFELLSIDLYDFIKKNHFQGVHINFAKRIIVQVLIALKCAHSLNITHCDIKPENILLKKETRSSIKLIDFGSAYKPGGEKFDYIQTRFYRAPEVILMSPWNEKIDIWSVGCLLMELITGWPLFTGSSETEVFYNMVKILGPPPNEVLNRGKNSEKLNPDHLKIKENLFNLHKYSIDYILEGQNKQLIEFVKNCLHWDDKLRFSAEAALAHAWIKGSRGARNTQ